jgi:hypothetical protein
VQAKASTDLTCWPTAIAKGVELRTGARVFEITTGRATGAHHVQFQPARLMILAVNGIGMSHTLGSLPSRQRVDSFGKLVRRMLTPSLSHPSPRPASPAFEG